MTSSVDAFEFKSIASTSSRYGVESRHQRAQLNISDELEPSPSVLSCKLTWSSASYSVKHDFKIENTLQVDWRHERYSSLNSRWIVGTWWVMQTITRPRHEQALRASVLTTTSPRGKSSRNIVRWRVVRWTDMYYRKTCMYVCMYVCMHMYVCMWIFFSEGVPSDPSRTPYLMLWVMHVNV